MRADKVEEEHEHGNDIIGGLERRKALFGLVPCLKLLVEAFDEIVGNIIFKTLDPDMRDAEDRFDRHFVGRIAVRNKGIRLSVGRSFGKKGNGLWGIPIGRKMEADDESRFAVDDKPEIVLDPGNFHNGFVGVPFVGIEIEQRQELNAHIVKQGRKSGTPVADRDVGNRNGKGRSQDKADVAEGIFAEIKHGERRDDEMDGIAHSLEIVLTKEG